jgi:hypothetical protein
MQSWHERVHAQHAEEVATGLHDEQCEWRAVGHFLCNCSPRKRAAEGYTEPPGELIHNYPTCPRCYEGVDHDGDSYVCRPCKVYWSSPTGPATFTDDHGELENMDHWNERQAAYDAEHG